MISESELRNALKAVAQKKQSVWEFAEWLDSKSWGMHGDSSPEAISLASSAERVLAEYDYHHQESVLLRELASILNNVDAHIAISPDAGVVPAQVAPPLHWIPAVSQVNWISDAWALPSVA